MVPKHKFIQEFEDSITGGMGTTVRTDIFLATILYINSLETAIRANRDAKGHNRCWYEREMYKLLPEHKGVDYELPSKEEFLKECEKYYHSCKKQEKD